ncbi:glycosyltransferase [Rufibacter glacialis]|uniref:Glycosyltransferase n=1 Tax=Rufibacter glacialis TaxID=1259555 RepID=A0A5M8Q9Y2_9BACT|nr:glycosyltransferase family 4 protein [Rufibacter glacialis]KAA6431923.1 glycosyltransferase family 4 protein [Rufibacter glacialis]GGK80377.1 glycosyl transferase family 1 [Rufibacter glacialis]
MIRKRILLASLLKPVSDTRLYEKIGKSLAKLPQLEIHVAGYAAPLPAAPESAGIIFHPVFSFQRLSIGRFTAQKAYWALLHKVQPAVLVVGTHELLLVSWLYAKRHRCQLVYDVQENYYLNLTTQQVYPGLLAKSMASIIRGIEKAVAPAIRHFFLAEQSYASELPFIMDRFTVLQNKYLPPSDQPAISSTREVVLQHVNPLRLLYSGTISKLYGVLEAIRFTGRLHKWVPSAELTIIGYCADQTFLQELQALIRPLPYVRLIGGNTLVPHQEILYQQRHHHVGLLPYRPHPSTFACLPTKLFEYIGNGLVVLMEENPLWAEVLRRTTAGTCLSFDQELSGQEVATLLHQVFYQTGIPEEVFWRQEEEKVQQVILALAEEG